jgi:cytochrome c-type biogenesis protein
MNIIKLDFLNREKRARAPEKITTWFGSIIMGMAFAAGWTPCFGPILGSILVYASSTATVSKGVYLLLAYSIGMAVPFIITAVFIDIFQKFMRRIGKYMPYISKISGCILIVFGVLIYFNKLIIISNWLIR